MNALFALLGIEHWKPWLQLLVLPPVPLLLLALLGAMLVRRRPQLARWLVLLSIAGVWLAACRGTGHWLMQTLNPPPPPLTPAAVAQLARSPWTAIVVLGAGRRIAAPEYDDAPDLRPLTHERLRYGIWLARQTRLPLAYTGGIGHGAAGSITEAEAVVEVMRRHDPDVPLRWLEDRSRDTNENARLLLPMLTADGIRRVVLVTHGFHQLRALAAFERAATAAGTPVELVPAPVGLLLPLGASVADWVPSFEGVTLTQIALHEWLGRLAGA